MPEVLAPLVLASPMPLRYPRTAGAASVNTCIAMVDADEAIREGMEAALHDAGFATEWIRLADFADGRTALAALVACDADVIVYELGERHRANPALFEELYAAVGEQETPLLIMTMAHWLAAEQEEGPVRGFGAHTSGPFERLVHAIHREVELHRRGT
jgi:DNA-binding NtrC family response regulator